VRLPRNTPGPIFTLLSKKKAAANSGLSLSSWSGRPGLEPVAGAHEVAGVQLLSEPELVRVASVGPQVLLEDVDALEGDHELFRKVVADVEVDLREGLHEHGVARAAAAGVRQELVAPVVGEAGRDAVLVVDRRRVGGVAQAQQSELALARVDRDVVADVALHVGEGALNPEAGLAEEVG